MKSNIVLGFRAVSSVISFRKTWNKQILGHFPKCQHQVFMSYRGAGNYRGRRGGRGGGGGRGRGRGPQEPQAPLYGEEQFVHVPPSLNPVIIHGDEGEGGGQILRYSVALSVLVQVPLEVDRIRAGRTPSGLRRQHLHGVCMLAEMCNGTLTGASEGSTSICLIPQQANCQDLLVDTGTAGSVTLLAQSALPVMLFAKQLNGKQQSVFTFNGGTDVNWSPPLDYLSMVLLPILRSQLGIDAEIPRFRRGFYPRGRGMIQLAVKALPSGTTLKPISIDKPAGQIVSVQIRVFQAGNELRRNVGSQCMHAAEEILASQLKQKADLNEIPIHAEVVEETQETAFGAGLGLLIICEAENGLIATSGLAEIRRNQDVDGEALGKEAALKLLELIGTGTPVDDQMQDQLIIFMALAEGESRLLCSEPTMHTQTAINVCQQLMKTKFTICPPGEGPNTSEFLYLIVCQGVGYKIE
eukprot:TRINITY_DN3893_c0_g1_i1.p1 TRINITY_DN3893_c0_g1~~TRINITY_DN3893_c0_g1_i1.p1  ORF type:complete len:468 (+),score=43.13 TRINITY_DN3893_c0_g1_i1:260-1663(+)